MNISRSHSMLDQLNRRPNDQMPCSRMIKEIINRVISSSRINQDMKDDCVLEAVSEEGLFEAARLANPMLPQYHPKQLIEMLNAGKTKRVKAILLHVLRALKVIKFKFLFIIVIYRCVKFQCQILYQELLQCVK